MDIPGIVVPPLTPFTPDLQVDYAALERGVDYVVDDCNAAVVVVAGVEAQEYQYLDLPQRRDLIRRTVEFVGGRRPTVVGVSHPSFKVSAGLAHDAEKLGADAIQLLAPLRPHGGQPSPEELERYVEQVAAETSLPIMLYLNAGPGAAVSPETTISLARLDSVQYIKESSRDLSRVARLIEEIDQAGHAHYFTTVQMMLISLQLGGSGTTLPPPLARIARDLLEAFLREDFAEAVRLQRQFAVYPAKWMSHGLAPVMKASLESLGIPVGQAYPPYAPIAGKELDELQHYLTTTDLEKMKDN